MSEYDDVDVDVDVDVDDVNGNASLGDFVCNSGNEVKEDLDLNFLLCEPAETIGNFKIS